MNTNLGELPGSTEIKVAPEFLRAPLARPFPFLHSKLPPSLEMCQDEEIKRELKSLYEKFAREKRKPDGKDTHAVREKIRAKYKDLQIQQGIHSELWNYSERILNGLRTLGNAPAPSQEQTAKAISTFFLPLVGANHFPETNPASAYYLGPNGYMEMEPVEVIGPNEYFIKSQPELVMNYGNPFHSSIPAPRRIGSPVEPITENLLGINTCFFGAFMGGDKRLGHDVVFYLSENRFYFWDLVRESYFPTTEAKLRLGLPLVIQRLAAGLVVDQASIILNKFLTDPVLDQIMQKAKTILSVERGFFEGADAKPRFTQLSETGSPIACKVKEFIETQIAVDETAILTISQCLGAFECYQHTHGASIPSVKEVKVIVQAKMREVYGKGVRNDILLPDNKCVAGWKGLRLDHQTV